MRRWDFFFPILAFFLFSPAGSSAEAQEAKGPRLHIEKPAQQADAVLQGQVVRHRFTISNHGDEALLIQKVRAG